MIVLVTSSVGIELLSSSARVTSVKSQQGRVSFRHLDPQIGPRIPGSDKKENNYVNKISHFETIAGFGRSGGEFHHLGSPAI